MSLTVLKKTPIHCVVAAHGAAGTETITLATTLLSTGQTASTPTVNITSLLWAIPDGQSATITRNGNTLWTLTGADNFNFIGYSDTRFNTNDIAITIPTGGTVIVECVKVSGYGDSQHLNQSIGA